MGCFELRVGVCTSAVETVVCLLCVQTGTEWEKNAARVPKGGAELREWNSTSQTLPELSQPALDGWAQNFRQNLRLFEMFKGRRKRNPAGAEEGSVRLRCCCCCCPWPCRGFPCGSWPVHSPGGRGSGSCCPPHPAPLAGHTRERRGETKKSTQLSSGG